VPFAVHPCVSEIAIVLERLDIDLGERRQLLARERALGSIPSVAKAENMSSKVQAWRTPVTEPSGA